MGGGTASFPGVLVEEDQRRHPRYQLASPLTGAVEQSGHRHTGSVLNVSEGGYYLHLPRIPEGMLKIQGVDDYGEIHYAGRQAAGFGHLVRIERFANGVGIGFAWDLEGLDTRSRKVIDELVAAQALRRAQGEVECRGRDIVLGGTVSSALAEDVLSMLRRLGNMSPVRISLDRCQSIDSSGVEMLMALRDRGLPIVEAHGRIAAHLERLRLLSAATKKE